MAYVCVDCRTVTERIDLVDGCPNCGSSNIVYTDEDQGFWGEPKEVPDPEFWND